MELLLEAIKQALLFRALGRRFLWDVFEQKQGENRGKPCFFLGKKESFHGFPGFCAEVLRGDELH